MPRPNGAQIRRRRQERGYSTAELASRVGFTNDGSMRNIENRNDPIAMIKLHRIARELGIAVEEITASGRAEDGQEVFETPASGDDRRGPDEGLPPADPTRR